jgi:trans-L-3-hydroxyproline dehydratase
MRVNRTITTVDAHAAGEPLRIILSGLPPLNGATMLERRAWMLAHHDDIRRTLLFEPRGHADMYGAVVTPPVSPDADFGVLFLTNEGYSTMCGHGIIALTTALLETGAFSRQSPCTTITYDSPAGLIRAEATIEEDAVTRVAFENVPAFRLVKGLAIDISTGNVAVDVCFGGAFYALIKAATLGISVDRANIALLVQLGMEIKRAVEAAIDVLHPLESELHGIYGTIISDEPRLPGSNGRNITIFADAEVDRSPCGTGTSARLAGLYADGKIRVGEPYVHESVIDTTFTGRVLSETDVAGHPAIITEISGRGFVTGFHTFVVHPEDPTRDGFLVR